MLPKSTVPLYGVGVTTSSSVSGSIVVTLYVPPIFIVPVEVDESVIEPVNDIVRAGSSPFAPFA